MSNGLTDVVMDVLCLAGATLAASDDEKEWMIWLAQKDQGIFGLGTIDFDISEMPWQREYFDAQKKFLLAVIDAAAAKTNWNLLNYQPREDWALDVLAQLRELVTAFQIEHLPEKNEAEIYPFEGAVKKFDRCAKHGVYMHFDGCLVCRNAVSE